MKYFIVVAMLYASFMPNSSSLAQDYAKESQQDSILNTLEEANKTHGSVFYDTLSEAYKYSQFSFKHRKETFEWQLFTSKVIFWIVILLVLVGVYFAWMQFYYTYKNLPVKSTEKLEIQKDPSSQNLSTLATDIEVTTTSIKVSSPVLGVIILVISFMFFFLYLKFVYPINEVGMP